MKTRFLWLLATVLSVGLTACNKGDDPSIEIPADFADVTFAEGVTNQTITFQANQSWNVVVTQTKADQVAWLTVSPMMGGGGKGNNNRYGSGQLFPRPTQYLR